MWDEGYLDRLQEGQTLEFDFLEPGEFRNISRIYEPNEKKAGPGTPSNAERPEDKLPEYGEQKARQIVRMSCLRSTSQILGGSRIPAGKSDPPPIKVPPFDRGFKHEIFSTQGCSNFWGSVLFKPSRFSSARWR